jgi:hypothetical protein
MRKLLSVLCFSAFLFVSLPSVAQADNSKGKAAGENVPSIITSGLKAYKDKGPEEAVRTWIKGSAIDGSKDALSQANTLRQVQDYYGAYQAFEIISARDLTARIREVYLVIDYEKGPLFAKFVVFKTDTEWILAYFNFNTKSEAILPTCP